MQPLSSPSARLTFLLDSVRNKLHTINNHRNSHKRRTTSTKMRDTMMESALLLGLLGTGLAKPNCVNGNQPNDPASCRMIVSSDLVYSMTSNQFLAGSGMEVIMKYDLTEDPSMKNAVNSWNSGYDLYLKTPFDYTRWAGPLGM
jgi:hypothetical protein